MDWTYVETVPCPWAFLDGDLKALDLSHNGLYGKVPRTLCTMFELRSHSVRSCLDFKSVVNDKLYIYFVNILIY